MTLNSIFNLLKEKCVLSRWNICFRSFYCINYPDQEKLHRMGPLWGQTVWDHALDLHQRNVGASWVRLAGFSNHGNGVEKKRVKNLRQHQNVCICIIQKIIFMTNIYDYFFSIALERKISIRANREILVQKGILLPESPINLSELKQPIYFGAISEVLLLLWCKGLKQTEQDRD